MHVGVDRFPPFNMSRAFWSEKSILSMGRALISRASCRHFDQGVEFSCHLYIYIVKTVKLIETFDSLLIFQRKQMIEPPLIQLKPARQLRRIKLLNGTYPNEAFLVQPRRLVSPDRGARWHTVCQPRSAATSYSARNELKETRKRPSLPMSNLGFIQQDFKSRQFIS